MIAKVNFYITNVTKYISDNQKGKEEYDNL